MDFKAGMFIYALVLLLACTLLVQSARLLDLSLISIILACVVLSGAILTLSYKHKLNAYFRLSILYILLFLIAFSYASIYASELLSHRLHDSLVAKNILVSGQVVSLPVIGEKLQRFEFEVDSFELTDRSTGKVEADKMIKPERLRLSWYYGKKIYAGDRWQFVVRLKPPHGFLNPGGFDYEAWLLQNKIDATGYVRKSRDNQLLSRVSRFSFDAIRQAFADNIDKLADTAQSDAFSLLKALAIGDKSSITNEQWRVLRNTGTSHLMAISGLHISLAALLVYVLVRRVLPVYVMKRIPAQHIAMLAGLFMALLYALLAGFAIPTQRAVIMLMVLVLMLLIRRNHRPLDALGFALAAVLLYDPLAVLSAGFWFSFSAVAVIFFSVTHVYIDEPQPLSAFRQLYRSIMKLLKQWLRLQLIISIALLPLSLYMFQQASLISPLVNLWLIPYVSFIIVPLVLLSILLSFIYLPAAQFLLALAAQLLDVIWPWLTWLADLPYALWIKGDFSTTALLMSITALLLLYLVYRNQKRSIRLAASVLSILLIFAALIPGKQSMQQGEYKLVVLDVGQGLANVVQTQNHLLVFDTGAKFSDRMNAGNSVVIPYIRSIGFDHIDRLVISHGDNDHIGGAQAVIDHFPDLSLIGQEIDQLDAIDRTFCAAGQSWQWDGVSFQFLSPHEATDRFNPVASSNDRSCVLHISSQHGSVLLTGDIQAKVESRLLEIDKNKLHANVVVVPHHGSNTSSSMAFIDAVDAEYALISVGYKNRYHHPSAKVVARYEANDSKIVRTDESGAIQVSFDAETGLIVSRYRAQYSRFWHHQSH